MRQREFYSLAKALGSRTGGLSTLPMAATAVQAAGTFVAGATNIMGAITGDVKSGEEGANARQEG